jgi:hypothetical protein
MNKYFRLILLLPLFTILIGCNKQDEQSKQNIQFFAEKEKELNDKEAKLLLKEKELEERERKLNLVENKETVNNTNDTTSTITKNQTPADTTKPKDEKKNKNEKKKDIQKDISKKFENPVTTVKDYFDYIQRGINDKGDFDNNMKKANKYYPGRSVDKLKNTYRKTKTFSVVDEPKLVVQKDNTSSVTTKVKQVELIKKDGNEQEVSKTLVVTYNLKANDLGQWVIVSHSVKAE